MIEVGVVVRTEARRPGKLRKGAFAKLRVNDGLTWNDDVDSSNL